MALKGQKPVQERELRALFEAFEVGGIGRWRTAIDGGAHVGGWTAAMSDRFRLVHAFEPCLESFELLTENVGGRPNVRLHRAALMQRPGAVEVFAPKRTTLTSRQVRYGPNADTPAESIDGLALDDLDFLKLDLEGAELLALRGAEQTIKRCRPFLMVEDSDLGRRFGHSRARVRSFIEGLGYQPVFQFGADRGYRAA